MREVRGGEEIYFLWDGKVLEVFDRGPGYRLHAALVQVRRQGPDRKGRYIIEIERRDGGRLRARPDNFKIRLQVDAQYAAEVLAMIDQVNAAGG